ncbi:SDR family oxidoreductase [Oceaniradius stylonematis]|uniref:SDR family oxidoreductase n=1 Tax=Oceaniradius stylonematis TaxID=2184161 RepID=UPI003C79D2D9
MAEHDHKKKRPAVLVTGGARRIGRAIVADLAANGFDVAIHASSSMAEARSLAASLSALGGRAVALQADLTDAAQARALAGLAAEALERPIDILVNNASVFLDDAVGAIDDGIWDAHFDLHVRAPVLLAQAFAKALPGDRHGLVVNMIDQRVWKPTPRCFSYTLSKSALWTATQTMAQALAPRIRVNAIGPGPTLKNPRQSDTDFAAQTDSVPLGRGPNLAEFGATIRYLWQARSVTGQMIALDGGQHLAWQTPDATAGE